MKFFTACHTIEDAKKLYRELCIKYHPDISGSDTTSIMQEINAEFDQIFISLKNIHRNKSGETYFKEQTKQTTAPAETAQQFRTIILKLVKMDGVRVELIGSWIWCSGNTRPYKDEFKHLNFKWSKYKAAWYYHSAEDGYWKKSKKNYSLDEVRNMFDSITFTDKQLDDSKLLHV